MWLRISTFAIAAIGVLFLQGCNHTSQDAVDGNATAPMNEARKTEKTNASPKGLDDALRDTAKLKERLKTKSPEQLIASFVPDPKEHYYGGYDYYYGDMANRAILDELQSRGAAARGALERHAYDAIFLAQGINGQPGYTVGWVCRDLIRKIGDAPAQPAQ